MEQFIWLFLGLIIGFLSATLVVSLFLSWRAKQEERRLIQQYESQLRRTTEQYEARLRQLTEQHQKAIEQARRQSVEQSRRTIKGQISEQLVPLLPGFEFSLQMPVSSVIRLITWSFMDTPICARVMATPISLRWCSWTSSATWRR